MVNIAGSLLLVIFCKSVITQKNLTATGGMLRLRVLAEHSG